MSITNILSNEYNNNFQTRQVSSVTVRAPSPPVHDSDGVPRQDGQFTLR